MTDQTFKRDFDLTAFKKAQENLLVAKAALKQREAEFDSEPGIIELREIIAQAEADKEVAAKVIKAEVLAHFHATGEKTPMKRITVGESFDYVVAKDKMNALVLWAIDHARGLLRIELSKQFYTAASEGLLQIPEGLGSIQKSVAVSLPDFKLKELIPQETDKTEGQG